MTNEQKPTMVIKSQSKRIVIGVVYAPDTMDTDGEFMSEEDIESMAYAFVKTGKVNNIDVGHNFRESGCQVVESFVARKGDPDFKAGSWCLGVHVIPDDLWADVLSGELNGFSFAGPVKKEVVTVLAEVVTSATGNTEPSTVDILPEHTHTFFVSFDDEGNIKSGKTDNVLGHSHDIRFTTATESTLDHSHRFRID